MNGYSGIESEDYLDSEAYDGEDYSGEDLEAIPDDYLVRTRTGGIAARKRAAARRRALMARRRPWPRPSLRPRPQYLPRPSGRPDTVQQDIQQTKAAVQDVDLSNGVQFDMVARMLMNHQKQINGAEYSLASSKIVDVLKEEFPDFMSNDI
jgi:hypothetical protein